MTVAIFQHLRHDNIICLPGQPAGRSTRSESCRKGERLMSTYEEFMVLLAIALLIVAILHLRDKLKPLCLRRTSGFCFKDISRDG